VKQVYLTGTQKTTSHQGIATCLYAFRFNDKNFFETQHPLTQLLDHRVMNNYVKDAPNSHYFFYNILSMHYWLLYTYPDV